MAFKRKQTIVASKLQPQCSTRKHVSLQRNSKRNNAKSTRERKRNNTEDRVNEEHISDGQ